MACTLWVFIRDHRYLQKHHLYHGRHLKVKVKVAQSCLMLYDPMGYTVHGIFQARIVEWVAVPFSRGSPQPRDWTQVSHIAGRFFTSWAARKAQEYWRGSLSLLQGIFLTQESNQGLLHCRWILYQLSYEGSCLGQPKLPGQGFPGISVVKNPPANTEDVGSIPGLVGKIPWSRKWQATPVFLPEKFYAQRSLVDNHPWGRKELDMTEHTSTQTPRPSLFWAVKLLSSSSLRAKGACDFFHLVGSETLGSCLGLIRHVDLIFPWNSANNSLN